MTMVSGQMGRGFAGCQQTAESPATALALLDVEFASLHALSELRPLGQAKIEHGAVRVLRIAHRDQLYHGDLNAASTALACTPEVKDPILRVSDHRNFLSRFGGRISASENKPAGRILRDPVRGLGISPSFFCAQIVRRPVTKQS
jgi:hypothetical protein